MIKARVISHHSDNRSYLLKYVIKIITMKNTFKYFSLILKIKAKVFHNEKIMYL